jgi:hypothetical protein
MANQSEADSLRTQLRYTTDHRSQKRLRERIDQLERQAKILAKQQHKKKPVDEK